MNNYGQCKMVDEAAFMLVDMAGDLDKLEDNNLYEVIMFYVNIIDSFGWPKKKPVPSNLINLLVAFRMTRKDPTEKKMVKRVLLAVEKYEEPIKRTV